MGPRMAADAVSRGLHGKHGFDPNGQGNRRSVKRVSLLRGACPGSEWRSVRFAAVSAGGSIAEGQHDR